MGASRSCLMRKVRGGQVEGESETGRGRGQTITRSIEGDYQIKEIVRRLLILKVLEIGT